MSKVQSNFIVSSYSAGMQNESQSTGKPRGNHRGKKAIPIPPPPRDKKAKMLPMNGNNCRFVSPNKQFNRNTGGNRPQNTNYNQGGYGNQPNFKTSSNWNNQNANRKIQHNATPPNFKKHYRAPAKRDPGNKPFIKPNSKQFNYNKGGSKPPATSSWKNRQNNQMLHHKTTPNNFKNNFGKTAKKCPTNKGFIDPNAKQHKTKMGGNNANTQFQKSSKNQKPISNWRNGGNNQRNTFQKSTPSSIKGNYRRPIRKNPNKKPVDTNNRMYKNKGNSSNKYSKSSTQQQQTRRGARNNVNSTGKIVNVDSSSKGKSFAELLLNKINQHRTVKLVLDTTLCQEATGHVEDVAAERVKHTHDGSTERLRGKDGGENLFRLHGPRDMTADQLSKHAVDGWMRSPHGHKETMLEESYTKVGFGSIVRPDGKAYVTALFWKE